MDQRRHRQKDICRGRTRTENPRESHHSGQTSENTVTLNRDSTSGPVTFGTIQLKDGPTIQTLEPPWAENRRNVSCIPEGTYPCRVNKERQLIHVEKVPDREGIQIHVGNFLRDTHGCILPGLGRRPDSVTESFKALALLLKYLHEHKLDTGTFFLEIKSCFSQKEETLRN